MPRHNLFYFLIAVRETAKGFYELVRTFSGWHGFVLFRFGIVGRASMESRDIGSQLKRVEMDRRSRTIAITYEKKRVEFGFESRSQFDNAMRNIYEIFIWEQYADLRLNGRTVVDVGANNGDSAIYFVLKGAKRVFSYEPYPSSFKQAEANVAINGMQKKIEVSNEAVLRKSSHMFVDEKYDSVSNSILKASKVGKRIRTVTLEDIVREHRLKNAVLKLDCEGSEYEILLGASERTLRKFRQIAIEYHFGHVNLVTKLIECGFKVRHTEPTSGRNAETNGLKMNYGLIYAYR
jgi:FkbM family methyltransferase